MKIGKAVPANLRNRHWTLDPASGTPYACPRCAGLVEEIADLRREVDRLADMVREIERGKGQ